MAFAVTEGCFLEVVTRAFFGERSRCDFLIAFCDDASPDPPWSD